MTKRTGEEGDPMESWPIGGDKEPEAASQAKEEGARSTAGRLSERFIKAAAAGLEAVFTTEEGLRGVVRDMKLPKEAVGFFADTAEKSKDELMRILGEEARRFFRSAAFRREVLDFLSEMTIEVDAKVRLKPGAMNVKVDSVEVEGPRRGTRKRDSAPKGAGETPGATKKKETGGE